MVVRPANLDDLDALLAFEQGVLDAERPFDPWTKTGDTHYYDLPALLSRDSSRVVVLEHEGELVASGYGDIRTAKEHHVQSQFCYLGMMYVKPDYRGKGLNKEIVQALIQWSQSRGIEDFVLDVYAENAGAIKAYEKAGFSPSLLEMRMSLPKA